ncbi:MAG: selenocysteine-specific translation elongation factor [Acidobacteria bacterium]|nr:selenocysteine-specific translation elongation factor [Acidobacteriota bacterium]MBS1864378.1 selenocysteine-specific translation elongation factor [Acidobacteriota bacterium]
MDSPIKHIIVGTAGHIDHGKSSLVQALTGTHPDRLEEERRRGITIDLGFAFLEMPGVRFGFVDVPGHEKFVSNMLAGATGVDLALLVIAADEGVKPQTREHFEICRLLGIKRGIVVLTKSDLVDVDTLGLVKLEIQEYLRGSFLENSPMLAVSVKTGNGLSELKGALVHAASKAQEKDSGGLFRLPIDRSFSIKGFGTVVTGTLFSGSVAPGDEIELLPGGERLRVRGVQSGGKSAEVAFAGQRTAINLAGIEHSAIRRGMSLTVPNRFRPSARVDVKLELLSSSPILKQRSRVHFHCGTFETIAEVRLHEGEQLRGGESSLTHLRLQAPMLVLPGDRFIIRQFSPVVTIGGGMILDNLARRPAKKDSGRIEFLKTLESADSRKILRAMALRAPFGLNEQEIAARTAWPVKAIQEAAQLEEAESHLKIVSHSPLLLVGRESFAELQTKVIATLDAFHKANPLTPGIAREDLRAKVARRTRAEIFRAALEELAVQKKLVLDGETVKRAGAEVTLQPDEKRAYDQIESAFAKAGLAVPPVKDVLAQLAVEPKRAEKLLQMLLREKKLQRVTMELIFHANALQEMRQKVAHFKKAKNERISVPAFKDLTGISRKYAIPLLEYLDRERVTRRVGDERVIL